jgi:fluoride exporter
MGGPDGDWNIADFARQRAAPSFSSRRFAEDHGPVFPSGTLFINLSGSILVGFFLAWTTERVLVDARWRLFVVVGFCSSFSTFSSYR